MRFIFLCAILLLSAACAVPPRARVVAEPHQKTKFLVSTSTNSAANEEKATPLKVVTARPVPSKGWRWVPRFQRAGKEDTTWGFLLRRPF